MDDYYRIVGAKRTASAAEIDQKSRAQMRRWQSRTSLADLSRRHEAERRMTLLGEARTVLLDPTKRARYDRELGLRLSTVDTGRETAPSPDGVTVSAAAPAEPPHALLAKLRKRWYLVVGGGAVGSVGCVAAAGPEAALPLLAVLIYGSLVAATPAISASRFHNPDRDG